MVKGESQRADLAHRPRLCGCSRRTAGGSAGLAGNTQLGELCRSTTFQVVAEKSFPLGRNSALHIPGVMVFRVQGRPTQPFSVAILAAPPVELTWAKMQETIQSEEYREDPCLCYV